MQVVDWGHRPKACHKTYHLLLVMQQHPSIHRSGSRLTRRPWCQHHFPSTFGIISVYHDEMRHITLPASSTSTPHLLPVSRKSPKRGSQEVSWCLIYLNWPIFDAKQPNLYSSLPLVVYFQALYRKEANFSCLDPQAHCFGYRGDLKTRQDLMIDKNPFWEPAIRPKSGWNIIFWQKTIARDLEDLYTFRYQEFQCMLKFSDCWSKYYEHHMKKHRCNPEVAKHSDHPDCSLTSCAEMAQTASETRGNVGGVQQSLRTCLTLCCEWGTTLTGVVMQ